MSGPVAWKTLSVTRLPEVRAWFRVGGELTWRGPLFLLLQEETVGQGRTRTVVAALGPSGHLRGLVGDGKCLPGCVGLFPLGTSVGDVLRLTGESVSGSVLVDHGSVVAAEVPLD